LTELIVSEKYINLIPRPSADDRESLKEDILANGQQVDIVINQKNVIIDGYTRFDVIGELGIKPKYVVKKFKNEEEEIKYILSLNLARRNLTVFQKVESLFPYYDEFERKADNIRKEKQIINKNGSPFGKKSKSILVDLISKQVDNDNTQVKHCLEILQYGNKDIILEVSNGVISPTIGAELVRQKKIYASQIESGRYEEAPNSFDDDRESSGPPKERAVCTKKSSKKPVSGIEIDCVLCDGHGKVTLGEIIEKLKFKPGWYVAQSEYHYFITKQTPICFKRTHVISTIGKKSTGPADLKGLQCKMCKKILGDLKN